jgi:hypothetical protein
LSDNLCLGPARSTAIGIRMTSKLAFLLTLTVVLTLNGQEPPKIVPGSLTLEEVVRLANAGISEELVVARVKRNAKAFDLNSDEILELKKSGVTETVIKFLLDPTAPYAPPPPPSNPPAAAAPAVSPYSPPLVPKDPLALKVPPETGIYYLTAKDEFSKLDLRPVVPFKRPGKVVPMLSAGMLKGHVIGSVVGPAARTRVAGRPLVFYARLPEKSLTDDLVLLNLDLSENRRDIDLGTKPGKPAFPVKSVRQFESGDVMQGLFRINVILDRPGEYLFFVLGSADDKKGLLGKGYDFGMDSRIEE